MSRETPHPVPPAFDDLRHLRRHTPGGWLIQHPLIKHPEPKPAPRPPVPIPRGYTSTRSLCQEFEMSPQQVRGLCRRLHHVHATIPGTTQPGNAYPAAPARRKLASAAKLRSQPTAPPPGYITARQTMQLLQCARSALTRYTKTGQLHPIAGRDQANTRSLHYFPLAEVQALRTRRISALQHKLQQLLSHL